MTTSTSPQFRLLASYLAPQRVRIAALSVLMLAGLVLELALPRVAQLFIDSALGDTSLQFLLNIGVAYLVVALFKNAVSVGWQYVAQNIGLVATNRMRTDLTLHCLKLDMSFHNARTPGEMIERIDGDVAKLANFMSSFLVQLVINGLLLVGVLGALLFIDWRVGAAPIVAVALALLSAGVLTRRLATLSAQERQASAELFGFVEERLSGTEDIRANGATAYVLRRHVERARQLFRAAFKSAFLGTIGWRSWRTAVDIGAVLALAIGALLYLDGVLSLGSVYAIFAYSEMLEGPIDALLREFGDLQHATASISRVRELFDTQPALASPTAAVALPAGALSVSIDDGSFAYPGDDAVLHDMSLHIPAGSTLGVLGRTGSGKTTLTRLILRLYDPTAGTVCLGGVDVRSVASADLRTRVAVVTQDVQLFSASVRDNLTLFDPSVPDDRIHAALASVGLSEWLLSLPRGLDTLMAPGGGGLSAGEAQLLAFARAFLRDPGLVILDEASSRLDPATERKMEQAVGKLLASRTGIIIAHRLSTLQRVSQILILEDGRVRENGPRERLAADPRSRFAQLLAAGIEQTLV